VRLRGKAPAGSKALAREKERGMEKKAKQSEPFEGKYGNKRLQFKPVKGRKAWGRPPKVDC